MYTVNRTSNSNTSVWSSSLLSYLFYWQQWRSTRLHPDARWINSDFIYLFILL